MRYIFLLLFCITVINAFSQQKTIQATKKNRALSFYEGKKYKFYFYKDLGRIEKGRKGKFTSLTDTSFVVKHRKGLDTVSISQIIQIHNYRSFSNIIGSIGEMGIGALIFIGSTSFESGFLEFLTGVIGVSYMVDGFASIFGYQSTGVLGQNPSVYRGFKFSIK